MPAKNIFKPSQKTLFLCKPLNKSNSQLKVVNLVNLISIIPISQAKVNRRKKDMSLLTSEVLIKYLNLHGYKISVIKMKRLRRHIRNKYMIY